MPQQETVSATAPSDRKLRPLTACVFALSVGLMLAAARGDLWLDEIWSIMIAREAVSPTDILVKFRHDNNHILNTLFQYVIGKQNVLYVHRLLAVAAGIGSLWLVGEITRVRGEAERLFATLLTGTSYPLILFFSESRGYAPAIFFSLLCLAVLLDERPRPKVFKAGLFWMASIAAILSHATFAMVLAALSSLVVVQQLHQRTEPNTRRLQLCLYLSVPVVFMAVIYFYFFRHIQFGGGPIYGRWEVICRAASLALAMPEGAIWGPLALAVVAGVTTVGTLQLYREHSAQWIFFPVVLFAAPAILITVTQPTYLYFRYFIVCIPFFYILLGYLLARYYRSGSKTIKWAIVSCLALFVLAQGQRIFPLLHLGRGNYSAAVEYIIANSAKEKVGIGSDHDFRNKLLLAFYTGLLPQQHRFYYVDQPDWKRSAPDWMITHSWDPTLRPPKQLSIPGVGKYRFAKAYRSAADSGWHWFLFRLE